MKNSQLLTSMDICLKKYKIRTEITYYRTLIGNIMNNLSIRFFDDDTERRSNVILFAGKLSKDSVSENTTNVIMSPR